jgi:hypothetical protein
MLRDLIGRCDAVIHLAGFYYGAEPQQRPPRQQRRSYTQIEYERIREGLPAGLGLGIQRVGARSNKRNRRGARRILA